jgi:hypothetical protein
VASRGLRLRQWEDGNDDAHKALRKRLAGLDAEDNARLFWTTDTFIQSIHAITDARERLVKIIYHDSPVELDVGRDLPWIKEALCDAARPTADRAVLLQAALRLSPQPEHWRDHVLELKTHVTEQPELLAVIDECLKPPKRNKELERLEKRAAELKTQRERRAAKDRASWILFWREVSRARRALSPLNAAGIQLGIFGVQ